MTAHERRMALLQRLTTPSSDLLTEDDTYLERYDALVAAARRVVDSDCGMASIANSGHVVSPAALKDLRTALATLAEVS